MVAKRKEGEEENLVEETFDEAEFKQEIEASTSEEKSLVEKDPVAENLVIGKTKKKPAVQSIRDHPEIKRRTLLIPPRPNRSGRFKRPLSKISKGERGRLLQLSTKKPVDKTPAPTPQVEIEPPNSVTNVKRIVRVVHRSKQPTNLDIVEIRTTREFGTQFGVPLGEFLKRRSAHAKHSQQSVVKTTEEPPLQGYWTHKVNLPYPPESNGQYMQQQQVQQQQQQQLQQQPAQVVQFTPQQQIQPQFIQATNGNLIQVAQQPQFVQIADGSLVQVMPSSFAPQKNYQSVKHTDRHRRRNYVKRQKYQQRKAAKQELRQ